jgi:hypothetical protein
MLSKIRLDGRDPLEGKRAVTVRIGNHKHDLHHVAPHAHHRQPIIPGCIMPG